MASHAHSTEDGAEEHPPASSAQRSLGGIVYAYWAIAMLIFAVLIVLLILSFTGVFSNPTMDPPV